ncbi:MAG: hypothetical protein AUJ01_02820 [Acidobacteria bacterium 13_1_40CM_3_65_5]|nr:MAG: hypothetical protein AUJ01_02820 [Acidobacteria bacterium 13_1_40CM_3_65_5]
MVEALLGCFQLHLIRLHFQDTRNPRRQLAMRSRGDVLHMQFEPSVSSLDFDVRRRRVPAVFGVIVGALEVVERGRDAEGRVRRGAPQGERPAGDDAARLDVVHRARKLGVQLERNRLQCRARIGARHDQRRENRLATLFEDHAARAAILCEHGGAFSAPELHAWDTR